MIFVNYIKQIIKKVLEERKSELEILGRDPKTLEPTLKKKLPGLAQGGPVQAGKPYIVGEQGPEVIIPNASGNVLSNDNSQIFAMLLAANPQLQNVSRTRSEKILRNRFPEYFE